VAWAVVDAKATGEESVVVFAAQPMTTQARASATSGRATRRSPLMD